MLPVNSGGHAAYQDFLLHNLPKYYPVPDSISHPAWDSTLYDLHGFLHSFFRMISLLPDYNVTKLPLKNDFTIGRAADTAQLRCGTAASITS